MRLLGKGFSNQQTGKRLLSFFMALLIAVGCIETLPTASAATATQTNPVVFKVRGAIDTNVSNGVKYSITVSEVYNSTLGYQSFTISYPTELSINTLAISTTDWEITNSGGSCSFILQDQKKEPNADGLKTLIESVYFTLAKADTYPEEGATVGITANERKITTFTDEDGYLHYYEFIDTSSSWLNWLQSYNEAKQQTFTDPYTGKVLTGYLATITSAEEQYLIYNSIAKKGGWLGGTRMVYNSSQSYAKLQDEDSISETIGTFATDTTNGSVWYWACGPEATADSGNPLVFWSQPIYSSSDPTGKIENVYSAFNNSLCNSIIDGAVGTGQEPNHSSNNEYVLQFAYSRDLWNDYRYDNNSNIDGYYVEFGGYEEDPKESDIKSASAARVELVMPVTVQYRSTVQDGNGDYTKISSSETTKDIIKVPTYIGGKYTVNPLASAPTGYTFSGYAFSGDDIDKAKLTADSSGNVSGYYSTSPQTVIFLYQPDSLTVSFDKNGGDSVSIASKSVTYQQEYGALATATKKGYTFDGWTDGVGTPVTDTTKVTSTTDHTLYAQWSEKDSFTVKYDLNGADSATENDKTLVSWTEAGLLPSSNPTRSGYSFVGWNVSVGGSKQGVTATDTYGDLADSDADGSSITLQAQWLENNSSNYTVIYRVNGADSPASIADEVLTSASDTVPTPTVTRMGYTFGGWQVIDDGTGSIGSAGSFVGSSDSFDTHSGGSYLILEAQWSLNLTPYTVTYKNNYTDATLENYAQEEDVYLISTNLVTAAGGTPTRDGYTFIGWNVKENGSGAYVTDSNRYGDLYALTGENDELILYAQWQENVIDYMVYYDLNGSSSAQPSPITVSLTDSNLLPTSDPDAPTGYTFRGWDVSYNGNKMNVTSSDSFQDLATDTSIHYIVLQAQWEPISTYTLVFHANGGIGDGTLRDISWTDISLPDLLTSNPTKSGYTFTGWNTKSDGSGKTVLETDSYGDLYTIAGSSGDSLTLYAQWVATGSYVVKYDVNGADSPNYLEEKTLTDTTATVDFPTVVREGYTFDGWKVIENGQQTLTGNCEGNEAYKDIAAMLDATNYVPYIILQAQWEPVTTYKLVFNANGGSGGGTEDVSWTDISLPNLLASNPTYSGYTFMGWNTAFDGSGKTVTNTNTYGELYAISNGSDNTLTLYAQWFETPVQYYTVHYDINCAGMENPPSKTRVKAEDSNLLPDTSGTEYDRTGYEITSWNVLYGGSKTNVQDTDAYEDLAAEGALSITLQAQWGIVEDQTASIKVEYYFDDVYDSDYDATITPSLSATVEDRDVKLASVPDGYIFDSTDPSLPLSASSLDGKTVNVYYVTKSGGVYTVSYKANGGSGDDVADENLSAGEYSIKTRSEAKFSRSGYSFSGWNTQADGKGTSYKAGETIDLSESMTLYAQWKRSSGGGGSGSYIVTYNANGGTGSHSDSGLSYGATYTVKSQSATGIAYTGYNFAGWNTQADGKGTSYASADTFSISGNVTLYAQWKEAADVNREDHVAYIIGYDDGTVQPTANITRAETATIYFRLLTDTSRSSYWSSSNAYSDVSAANWYNNAVSTMASANIVSGYTDGTFGGNRNITRAEFAAIAARFDSTIYSGADKFSDISGHWAAEYINRAAEKGWITGYADGTFKPNQYITRAEAMTLINRVLDRDHACTYCAGIKTWPDCPSTLWCYDAVEEATNSHDYSIESDGSETWTAVTEAPDWASLEKSWSTANSI